MTLLDAPDFDEARDRRNRDDSDSAVGLLLVLFIGWWLVAGRPVDWPWNWNNHLRGRMAVNASSPTVEKNDLPAAYGIWMHDKDWQQHPAAARRLPLRSLPAGLERRPAPITNMARSTATGLRRRACMAMCCWWESSSTAARARRINLDYDPKTHTLNFSPDVRALSGGAVRSVNGRE